MGYRVEDAWDLGCRVEGAWGSGYRVEGCYLGSGLDNHGVGGVEVWGS